MKPTDYERKLQNLINDLQIVLLDGKSIHEEGYAEDVCKRTLKAERALEALKNELRKGEKK